MVASAQTRLTAQQTQQASGQQILTIALPSIAGQAGAQSKKEDKSKTVFEKIFGIDLQSVAFVIAGLFLLYILAFRFSCGRSLSVQLELDTQRARPPQKSPRR